jgi:hypothetical protein
MFTDADRKDVAAQIREFSSQHRGNVASELEKAGIQYKTWRRAAQLIIISGIEFKKIQDFLSDNSLAKSSPETGLYTKDDFKVYYGLYNVYRPNSVNEARIEVFPAKFSWNRNVGSLKLSCKTSTTPVQILSSISLREISFSFAAQPKDGAVYMRWASYGTTESRMRSLRLS